jgi:hypothetical protein
MRLKLCENTVLRIISGLERKQVIGDWSHQSDYY